MTTTYAPTHTATPVKTWSPFQQAIFDHVERAIAKGYLPAGNLMVKATAGAGKTTTLVETVKRMAARGVKSILVLAYGTGITAELRDRLKGVPGVKVQGTYGAGFALVGKLLRSAYGHQDITVEEGKYHTIVRDAVAAAYPQWLAEGQTELREGEVRAQLLKLVDYARTTLTDANNQVALMEMAGAYNLDYELCMIPAVAPILAAGIAEAKQKGIIDFTDQVWLPNVLRAELIACKPWQYSAVLLDEAQDVSNAQRGVAQLSLYERNGMFVGVGDPNQSIMGFAGADMRSFETTTRTFKATVLELPVCYRSDLAIIREMQRLVPGVQGRPDAPEGVVRSLPIRNLFGELKARVAQGQSSHIAGVCRTTAPLVSLCIELIKDRIPAQVKGRDIGEDLVGYLDKIAQLSGFDYMVNVREYAETFAAMQTRKHMQADGMGGLEVIPGRERQVQRIRDYVDALLVCWESFHAPTLDALKREILSLFSDNVRGITLMTGHRSKGLEFDHVFILESDKMRLSWPGMTKDQQHQEFCVEFVMTSRARHELVKITPR